MTALCIETAPSLICTIYPCCYEGLTLSNSLKTPCHGHVATSRNLVDFVQYKLLKGDA